MHRAEEIIQTIVTKVTNLATTGANVFRGRAYPTADTQLPGLLIYLGPDRILKNLSQSFVDSELSLSIEARVKSASSQVDTLLNAIRSEITVALMADITQGLSYIIETREGDAAAPEISGDGDQPIASMRLEYFVVYRRPFNNPEV